MTPLPTNDTIEPVEFKEPDWKRFYYSMAAQLMAARIYLDTGNTDRAKHFLNQAANEFDHLQARLKAQDSMILCVTTPNTTGP